MKKSLLNTTIMAILAAASSTALAGSLTVPNTFTADTPAVATEVNDNFTAVKTAVDDNDGRITTNTADIATNGTAAAANATAIATKADASAVATNAADIATNSTATAINSTGIATNATAIATKADASAVTANASGIATNATAIATKADASAVTANTADIATNAAAIVTNATAIAAKADASTVTTNTADIATNAANVAVNVTNIATNATGIATNATGIATNVTDIATNATGIATNVTDIATNATGIATNVTDIATNAAAITTLQAANTCPSDMVSAGTLCVDKYEASVYSDVSLSTIIAGANINTACQQDGSDCSIGAANPIYAGSVAGVMPSFDITYYQASVACANVGKRLPTISEWQMAASGTPAGLGDGTTGCNGSSSLNTTGLAGANCQSTAGAFDMVGNVFELTADLVFPAGTIGATDTLTDTDTARVVALGDDYNGAGALHSFKSAVVTGPSDTGNATTGFRCVK